MKIKFGKFEFDLNATEMTVLAGLIVGGGVLGGNEIVKHQRRNRPPIETRQEYKKQRIESVDTVGIDSVRQKGRNNVRHD